MASVSAVRDLTADSAPPAEQREASIRVWKLGMLGAQLTLIILVVQQFRIEGPAFLHLLMLCLGGFLAHALLPLRWRLAFFVLLSWVGFGITLGAVDAAWVDGLALLLIGLCHLPASFRVRVALMSGAGLALAACRVGWVAAPWPHTVWPVLGSMFMFRLLIYLYDLRYDDSTRSIWQTLAYFFLLPNVCFALFPVIDQKTFRRTYYNEDPYRIYQVGVQWMVRGIAHLLAYRFLYHYCTLAPSEVRTGGDLLQFLLANFGLYLRVSGSFHLIVGILRLFGFNLPPTHHLYFLAVSVPDFWRRINIYWKDFMQKLFFLPALFAVRRRAPRLALVTSTFFVFVMTWLLHSYQWFWIGGTFPLTWQDAVFWGVLGAVMLAHTVYGETSVRAYAASTPPSRIAVGVGNALRIGLTFSFLCVLWSLWTADSIAVWSAMWAAAWAHLGEPSAASAWAFPLVVGSIFLAIILGSVAHAYRWVGVEGKGGAQPRLWPSNVAVSVFLVGLYVVSFPATYLRLGWDASAIVHALRNPNLNRLDADKLRRGYYEDLFIVARVDSPLAQLQAKSPPDWVSIGKTSAARPLPGLLGWELVPSAAVMFKGAPFHVNRWGMRDRDYTFEKPPGTYRIALLGSSHAAGSGVGDDETFENLTEDRLNRTHPEKHFEILNFAVPGYSPLEEMLTLDRKAFRFNPDAVLYFAHAADAKGAIEHLARAAQRGVAFRSPFLVGLLRDAEVSGGMSRAVVEERLKPVSMRLLTWVYEQVVQQCHQHGVLPVWVFLPMANERLPQSLADAAREAGFATLDLSGAYRGQDRMAIRISASDGHPNAFGHQLLANRLYDALQQHPEIVGMLPSTSPPSTVLR